MKPVPNASKYKGVSKSNGKWLVRIEVDSIIYSKLFETEEDAAQWRAKVDWKYIKKNKIPSSSKARKVSISPTEASAHLGQKRKVSKKKSKVQVSAPDSDSDDGDKKPRPKKKAASKPLAKKKAASVPKKSAAQTSNDSSLVAFNVSSLPAINDNITNDSYWTCGLCSFPNAEDTPVCDMCATRRHK
jgi:hypothetical protein